MNELVVDVAKALNVTLHEYDINISSIAYQHRKNTLKKSMMIINSKRIELHGNEANYDPDVPVYITDHLISYTMSIFEKASELKNQGVIFHTWITDGKIYLREEKNGSTKRIKETSDLYYGDNDHIHEDRQESPSLGTTTLIQPKANKDEQLQKSQINLNTRRKNTRSSLRK